MSTKISIYTFEMTIIYKPYDFCKRHDLFQAGKKQTKNSNSYDYSYIESKILSYHSSL